MITQETASKIWIAYREIEAAGKLLADMAKVKEERARRYEEKDRHLPTLKDVFGRYQHMQIGIPSGENAHTLFNVSPELAESIIRVHITNKKMELAEANERARLELMEDERKVQP